MCEMHAIASCAHTHERPGNDKKKKIFLAPQVTDQAREPRGDAEKRDFEPWPTDFTYASRATQVRDGVVQAGVLKKNERSQAYPLFSFLYNPRDLNLNLGLQFV